MSQQRLTAFTASAQVRNGVDQVEARIGKGGGYVMGKAQSHVSTVPAGDHATEVNRAEEAFVTACQSQRQGLQVASAADLQNAYSRAIDAGGFDDKGAAAVLVLSPSQLSRQLRGEANCHLSVQRLALLPRDSQVAFVQAFARCLGLDVVMPDSDALAMAELIQAVANVLPRFRLMRGELSMPVLADRRRA